MGFWRRPSPTRLGEFHRAAMPLHITALFVFDPSWSDEVAHARRMPPWHSQALPTMYPSYTTLTSKSSRAMRVAVRTPGPSGAKWWITHGVGRAGGGGGGWGGRAHALARALARLHIAYTRHPPAPRRRAAPHRTPAAGLLGCGPWPYRCWPRTAEQGGTLRARTARRPTRPRPAPDLALADCANFCAPGPRRVGVRLCSLASPASNYAL